MEDRVVFDVGPDSVVSRNSEGSFIRLRDGRIMFAYSRFTGTGHDYAPSDIYKIYSSDEGETWTEPELMISASEYGVQNIMSVSFLRLKNGEIGLFHGVKNAVTWNRKVFRKSADEGKSWSEPVYISDALPQGYYVMNNDRAEMLSNGRIIMPMSFHFWVEETPDGKPLVDHRAFACFVFSDDNGETWNRSGDLIFPPFHEGNTGLQETGIVIKKNDVIWAYNRTDRMYQYECFSFDGGMHFTKPQQSRFTSPDSPMKIKRNEKTGDLFAVWNPIPNYNGRQIGKADRGRTPLVYAVSHDDGETFGEQQIIEGDPTHGYSYPAVFFTDNNSMLVAYCAGGIEDKANLNRLHIKKIDIKDI